MQEDKKYQPISCSQYDELELLAMRKTVCQIEYMDIENKASTIQDYIATLRTEKKEEFLVLGTGQEIRLDKIITINGIPIKDHC